MNKFSTPHKSAPRQNQRLASTIGELKVIGLAIASATLIGCGGSDDNAWVQGQFSDSAVYEAQCANPRSGNDPQTNRAYADKPGSVLTENNWLRSWSNELYLWYSEITDRNPGLFSSTNDYFDLLKTTATTPSGNDKDRFHFTYPTEEWIALSQSGISAGYGAQFTLISSKPPRDVRVAYNDPNTPAAAAGLDRGAVILEIDGENVANGSNVDTLNAGMFPANANESHTFLIRDVGASSNRKITLVSADIISTPVQKNQIINTATGKVGYFLFNDHIATAEEQLIAAVEELKTANIDDLIIDLRYNGGGYLAIASQLAYMVAGNAATNNASFETLVFNDKHPSVNPVTQEPLEAVPFYNQTGGFSAPSGQNLPSLDLSRVFVLTGSNTCSASEAIINSLRGIGVEVFQFGATTCGKPYGFYPTDNCGTTYFSVQFRGENNAGFGDYSDGFTPQNATGIHGVDIPGCAVADDLASPLGDINEARLAAALEYRISGSCPTATDGTSFSPGSSAKASVQKSDTIRDGLTPKSPWLNNRILR